MLHYKGAVNDVGHAMGLSVYMVKQLSDAYGDLSDEEITLEQIAGLGLNYKDQQLLKVIELTSLLIGFPRQLGLYCQAEGLLLIPV